MEQNMNTDKLIAEVLAARSAGFSAATRRRYAAVQVRIVASLGAVPCAAVTPLQVATFMASLSSTPNSDNHALSVLRISFDYALERGLVASNPAVGIKRRKEAKRDRLLTAAELSAIRTAADPQLRCIMDLCVLTGQRIGDVLALRSDAVQEAGLLVRASKTGKSLIVGWTEALITAVGEAQALPCHERLLPPTPQAAPLYNTVLKRWRTACRLAGVQDANIHDMRAYAATEADRQGLNATALLGHSSPAVTARYLRDRAPKVVMGPDLTRRAA
jgi:integrase